jgi:hypothetical protein
MKRAFKVTAFFSLYGITFLGRASWLDLGD